MHPDDFHSRIDQPRLTAALKDVEHHTRGRVYVYVSHRAVDDPLAQAQRRFDHLGLSQFHHHQPVALIYIAPRTHKFAILGNAALHERCGDAYWNGLAESFGLALKTGDVTAALLEVLASLKATMLEQFPAH